MPDITDPQAVRFCNEKIRTMADDFLTLYYTLKRVQNEWTANPDLATAIPDDDTYIVVDGSATDGRHPITGADVRALIGYAGGLVTDLEANTNAKLLGLGRVAVNAK